MRKLFTVYGQDRIEILRIFFKVHKANKSSHSEGIDLEKSKDFQDPLLPPQQPLEDFSFSFDDAPGPPNLKFPPFLISLRFTASPI